MDTTDDRAVFVQAATEIGTEKFREYLKRVGAFESNGVMTIAEVMTHFQAFLIDSTGHGFDMIQKVPMISGMLPMFMPILRLSLGIAEPEAPASEEGSWGDKALGFLSEKFRK